MNDYLEQQIINILSLPYDGKDLDVINNRNKLYNLLLEHKIKQVNK